MVERKRETVKESKRERERERRGEYENREEKEKALKTDVPKLYAYNQCENSVIRCSPDISLPFKN